MCKITGLICACAIYKGCGTSARLELPPDEFSRNAPAALIIKVLVRTVPPVVSFSYWRHFFLLGTSQCRLEFSGVQKDWINAHTRQGLTLSGSGQS